MRLNWSGECAARVNDDVTIDVAANPTIRMTSGARSIRSLVCNEALNISGGSLRVANAAQVNNSLTLGNATLYRGNLERLRRNPGHRLRDLGRGDAQQRCQRAGRKSLTVQNGTAINCDLRFGGNSSLTAGAGVALVVSPMTRLTGGTLTARDGAVLRFPNVTELSSVNLTAASGWPDPAARATTYTTGSFGNTLQAGGSGSKIVLSALTTFVGSGHATPIKAERGGTVVLAGQFRGNTVWTLNGAGSTLDADRVTKLADATLNVSNGATLSFPALTEAANVNLTAASAARSCCLR